jgi:cytochrome c biogenesis factor
MICMSLSHCRRSSLAKISFFSFLFLPVAGVMYILLLTIPETYAPVLLKRRAAKLRQQTGRDNIKTEQEIFAASLGEILKNTLIKPFS